MYILVVLHRGIQGFCCILYVSDKIHMRWKYIQLVANTKDLYRDMYAKCRLDKLMLFFSFNKCKWCKQAVYFNRKEFMLQNSYLDKHQTENKVLQSWKGKEFIEGWGLSYWLYWRWWEGRSLVVLGVRGQLLALNSCPKSSRDKD